MNMEMLELMVKKGMEHGEPDFKVLQLAMKKNGGKIISMKNDIVYVIGKPGSIFITDKDCRQKYKHLLNKFWNFTLKWKEQEWE